MNLQVKASAFATLILCASAQASLAQTSPAAPATPAPAPAAPAASTAAPAPAAPAPAADAPSAPPAPPAAYPSAYPPPGYYPPGYYPPPSAYPPPGYYPPPGSYPPPGYYPAMQPEGPPPGHHEHDGFYMRLTFGGGYLHSSATYQGRTTTLSGGGPAMNLAFGGVVSPNLILFGEMSISSAIDPSFETTGSESGTAHNQSVNQFNFGPGLAYYFDTANVYLSGAFTLSQMTVDYRNSNNSDHSTSRDLTDMGFGGTFMAGKEWWVSSNWGLGLASMLQLASMKAKGVDARWFTTSVSILFSATYN